MNFSAMIQSQYLAALEMLKGTITRCPESIWNSPDDKTPFWQIAYHTLFFTHLYIQDSIKTYAPWHLHRNDYESLGHDAAHIAEPYDKATVLDFMEFCGQEVAKMVPELNLEGESGFDWLPMNKLELQIYNIRHIQQHTGELMERLGGRTGAKLDWVSFKRG